MKIKIYTIIISVIVLFFASCVPEQKITKTLPTGNLNKEFPDDSINTNGNNVAPIAVPDRIGNSSIAWEREMIDSDARRKKITTSKVFLDKILMRNDYNASTVYGLTKNLESVSLTTDTSGFVAFSHPPTEEFASYKLLPIIGNIGGTDIFEFKKESDGRFTFEVLPKPINSIFWDSHPFVTRDTTRNQRFRTLLLWASDRQSPFERNLPNRVQADENSSINLYYVFRDEFGRWGQIDSLSLLNTKADEVSPFIYCLCCDPVLLFASNRKSEKDFTKKRDFDIYYSRINVDFNNMQVNVLSEPKLLSEVYKEEGDIPTINSVYNEVFPYIPNPISLGNKPDFLYFASDRFKTPYSLQSNKSIDTTDRRECPCQGSEADSVLQNVGSFDIYRFSIPPEIKCIPPPPPVLSMVATVNLTTLSANDDTLDIKQLKNQDIVIRKLSTARLKQYKELNSRLNLINDSLIILEKNTRRNRKLIDSFNQEKEVISIEISQLIKSIPAFEVISNAKSDVVYKADLAAAYLFSKLSGETDCFIKGCGDILLLTPDKIYVNDTLYVDISCFQKPRAKQPVEFSYSKGLSFFVTGYWWPNTVENLNTLKNRIADTTTDCLKESQFIDILDYDYDEVAMLNSNYLDNVFYPKIDSILSKLDPCFDFQTLRIVIYGMTDPCRLRNTPNDEQTRYSCDPDILYNGQIPIKQGTNMKHPNLVDITGKPVSLTYGSQEGNYMLAMLRSYYTMETIDKGLMEKSPNYRKLKEKRDLFEVFELKAIGIDRVNQSCPNVWNDFVNSDKFKNMPKIPEECNLPYSRRVMIYADVVTFDELERGFTISMCGERSIKRTQIPEEPSPITVPPEIVNKQEKKDEERYVETGCPGPPCYFWIEFAVAENEEQADFIINILLQAEIYDFVVDRSGKPYIYIVSELDTNREKVEDKLIEYQEILKRKLSPLVKEIILKMDMKF